MYFGLNARTFIKNIVHGFSINQKDYGYISIMTSLLNNYKNMDCKMSLKIHYLRSGFGSFSENFGEVSDELSENFTKISLQ